MPAANSRKALTRPLRCDGDPIVTNSIGDLPDEPLRRAETGKPDDPVAPQSRHSAD